MEEIKQKLIEAENLGTSFDEESFIEHIFNRPIWQRLYDGSYALEETEEIQSPFNELLPHLSELYRKREKRISS